MNCALKSRFGYGRSPYDDSHDPRRSIARWNSRQRPIALGWIPLLKTVRPREHRQAQTVRSRATMSDCSSALKGTCASTIWSDGEPRRRQLDRTRRRVRNQNRQTGPRLDERLEQAGAVEPQADAERGDRNPDVRRPTRRPGAWRPRRLRSGPAPRSPTPGRSSPARPEPAARKLPPPEGRLRGGSRWS